MKLNSRNGGFESILQKKNGDMSRKLLSVERPMDGKAWCTLSNAVFLTVKSTKSLFVIMLQRTYSSRPEALAKNMILSPRIFLFDRRLPAHRIHAQIPRSKVCITHLFTLSRPLTLPIDVFPNRSLIQSQIEHTVLPCNPDIYHEVVSPFNYELSLDEFTENLGMPNAFQRSPAPFEEDLNTSLTLSNDDIPYVFQLSPRPELFCENAIAPSDLLRQLPTDFMSILLNLNIECSDLNPPAALSKELYARHRLTILTKSLLPSNLEVRLGKGHIDTVVFKTAVFQLVNNMIRIDIEPIEHVLQVPRLPRNKDAWKDDQEYLFVQILSEFLERDSPRRSTKLFDHLPTPYSDSLKRTLFRFALMARARRVTQAVTHMILDAGAVIETEMLPNLASLVDCNTIKRILLRLDSFSPKHGGRDRSIVLQKISCGLISQFHGIILDGSYEVLDLMMKCAPEFPTEAEILGPWICLNDRRIMEMILDRAPEPKSAPLLQWVETSQVIAHTAKFLDEGLSEWVFQELLPRLPNYRSHQIPYECSLDDLFYSLSWDLSNALGLAFSRNQSKIIDLLLEANVCTSSEPLIAAVHRRNQCSIRRLLDAGADPHAIYTDMKQKCGSWVRPMPGRLLTETTAYAESIRIGFLEGTRLFDIICPTNLLSSSPASLYILSAACQSGMVGLVSSYLDGIFLEYGTTTVQISDGYMLDGTVELVTQDCLLSAIHYRHEQIVHKLLVAGVLVNTDHLVLAMLTKDAILTHELLDCYNQHDPNLDISKLLGAALSWADASIFQKVLKGHCSPWIVVDVATLCVAIKHQDRIVIQWLLDAGADINGHRVAPDHCDKEYSPLKAAVETNDSSLVDYVLYLGADPHDSAALTTAITADRTEIVGRLLAAFKKRFPKSRGRHVVPGLRIAVDRNDLSLVKALAVQTNLDWVEYHSASFEIESYSYSLLGVTIIKPTADALVMMQVLLELRADPNTIAFIGYGRGSSGSPLQLAIREDSLEKFKLLLKYGANIHLKPHRAIKQTPLQYACRLGRYSMVVNLLEQGADVNAPASFNGEGTALQFASIGGFIGIVELLLHHHADVNAPPSKLNGRTCFEGATEHGRLDTMIFLMKNGADIVSDGGNRYKRAVKFAQKNKKNLGKESG
jgi:hypothetical protein